MAVINSDLGSPLTISIGKTGFRPDFYAARIVGPVKTERAANGRTNRIAPVIYQAKNLAGEEYLAERDHNLAFAFDRDEICPMLDGSESEPMTWQELVKARAKGLMAHLQTLPVADQVVAAEDLPV